MTTQTVTFHVFRGDADGGAEQDYQVPITEGMVVLDAIHYIQAHQAGDLACRWNCKAAKCGSCAAEVNGHPRLMCKTRVDQFEGKDIHVHPLRTFPLIKDLVTDVSYNYEVNKQIAPLTLRPEDATPQPWVMHQQDVERLFEYRKCIECFLCQDVCHVLRNHHREGAFFGPRYLTRLAYYIYHPKDALNRIPFARDTAGVGFCNITKCCTEVCPEHIHITDNAIIPVKEKVADEYFDPIRWLIRKTSGKKDQQQKMATAESPAAAQPGS
ncbi:MAG: succinate dehydrogenase/fumarate reductase iron-sulfur subunit [Chloroflexi bacterium]|nr:succinate dehydrogenase/fumarate reductase iron-sulfur subunit [Chloroflexota bacterium]